MAKQGARVSVESEADAVRWYMDGKSFRWMTEEHERIYGTKPSVAAFQSIIRRRGLPPRSLRNNPLIPWDVRREHQRKWTHTQLRNENRRRNGLPVSESAMVELERWKLGLEKAGAVVDYRRDTEDGYFLVPRRDGVDTDIIRKPEEAKV